MVNPWREDYFTYVVDLDGNGTDGWELLCKAGPYTRPGSGWGWTPLHPEAGFW
jgi:hypothetical protein